MKLDEALKTIAKQNILIKELKAQIPCPVCHVFGREKRYCPTCEVVCSPQELDHSDRCLECKSKVGDCPHCMGTGKKYANLPEEDLELSDQKKI